MPNEQTDLRPDRPVLDRVLGWIDLLWKGLCMTDEEKKIVARFLRELRPGAAVVDKWRPRTIVEWIDHLLKELK